MRNLSDFLPGTEQDKTLSEIEGRPVKIYDINWESFYGGLAARARAVDDEGREYLIVIESPLLVAALSRAAQRGALPVRAAFVRIEGEWTVQ